jgi:hypothetical protein
MRAAAWRISSKWSGVWCMAVLSGDWCTRSVVAESAALLQYPVAGNAFILEATCRAARYGK